MYSLEEIKQNYIVPDKTGMLFYVVLRILGSLIDRIDLNKINAEAFENMEEDASLEHRLGKLQVVSDSVKARINILQPPWLTEKGLNREIALKRRQYFYEKMVSSEEREYFLDFLRNHELAEKKVIDSLKIANVGQNVAITSASEFLDESLKKAFAVLDKMSEPTA